jgi:hypothetical protein
VGILMDYVICRGYRERLGWFIQDPTIHTTIVTQMTHMVYRAEENYRQHVAEAFQKLSTARIGAHLAVDKFDRVY